MEPTNTAIQAQDTRLVSYTSAIEAVGDSITAKAQLNVRTQLEAMRAQGDDREFGQLEIEAMEQVEALKLVGGLDLYSILLRYKFLCNIRDHNLLNVHPGRYEGLKQMAEDQGISISELHDIMKLGDVIFPFMTREYGENAVADMWEDLGKARIRELVATLSAAINGTPSQSANVRVAINAATQVAATQHAVESTLDWESVEPAERNRRIAREIVEIARRAPNVREMRHALRGTTTENILFITKEVDGRSVILAELSADQKTMLTRLMTDRIDFQSVGQTDGGFDGVDNVFLTVNAMLERARVRLNAPAENE